MTDRGNIRRQADAATYGWRPRAARRSAAGGLVAGCRAARCPDWAARVARPAVASPRVRSRASTTARSATSRAGRSRPTCCLSCHKPVAERIRLEEGRPPRGDRRLRRLPRRARGRRRRAAAASTRRRSTTRPKRGSRWTADTPRSRRTAPSATRRGRSSRRRRCAALPHGHPQADPRVRLPRRATPRPCRSRRRGRRFDHTKAAFQLAGAHRDVACAKCHVNQVFKGLKFAHVHRLPQEPAPPAVRQRVHVVPHERHLEDAAGRSRAAPRSRCAASTPRSPARSATRSRRMQAALQVRPLRRRATRTRTAGRSSRTAAAATTSRVRARHVRPRDRHAVLADGQARDARRARSATRGGRRAEGPAVPASRARGLPRAVRPRARRATRTCTEGRARHGVRDVPHAGVVQGAVVQRTPRMPEFFAGQHQRRAVRECHVGEARPGAPRPHGRAGGRLDVQEPAARRARPATRTCTWARWARRARRATPSRPPSSRRSRFEPRDGPRSS